MNIQAREQRSASAQAGWLAAAAVIGFAASSVFSGVLALSRNVFLVPYGLLVAIFLYAYVRACGIELVAHLRSRPVPGLVGAAGAAVLVIWNVLSQPASAAPGGWELAFALAWLGVFYGAVDALLLSVMPVVAVWLALPPERQTGSIVRFGAAAMIASAVVTATYHLGYAEFRGPQVAGPIIGNLVLTAAYLLARSPLSAVLAHVAMHVAAVLHGMQTTVQLPPH